MEKITLCAYIKEMGRVAWMSMLTDSMVYFIDPFINEVIRHKLLHPGSLNVQINLLYTLEVLS